MGFSIAWVAVQTPTTDAVLGQLGLRPNGRREEFPESPMLSARLNDGWFLVFANRVDPPFLRETVLSELALLGPVITCVVDEHVMYSAVSGWNAGRRMWSAEHDSRCGVTHLVARGKLPPDFLSLRDSLMAQQRDEEFGEAMVDYVFDIPIELAREIAGFRHDSALPGAPENAFEVLKPR